MKDNRLYLIDIAECIHRIESYTHGGRDQFLQSTMIQDAVIRNFEIMGEAAKQLSQDFKEANPDVPWRRIGGFRDVLIHAYHRVRLDEVWVYVEGLSELKQKIQTLLRQAGGGS
jgi:uncharacterized protein with HEPN domain